MLKRTTGHTGVQQVPPVPRSAPDPSPDCSAYRPALSTTAPLPVTLTEDKIHTLRQDKNDSDLERLPLSSGPLPLLCSVSAPSTQAKPLPAETPVQPPAAAAALTGSPQKALLPGRSREGVSRPGSCRSPVSAPWAGTRPVSP